MNSKEVMPHFCLSQKGTPLLFVFYILDIVISLLRLYLRSPIDITKIVVLVIFIFQREIPELSGNHSDNKSRTKQIVGVVCLSLLFLTRKMNWIISRCILERVYISFKQIRKCFLLSNISRCITSVNRQLKHTIFLFNCFV